MPSPPVPPYLMKQNWSPESLAVYIEGFILRPFNIFYIGSTIFPREPGVARRQAAERCFRSTSYEEILDESAKQQNESAIQDCGNSPRFDRFPAFEAATTLPRTQLPSRQIPTRTKYLQGEDQGGILCMSRQRSDSAHAQMLVDSSLEWVCRETLPSPCEASSAEFRR